MIFIELVLQNFGPYLGRQVINLVPKNDLNDCPIILLGGMNGGGKTTLLDAIRLALYGHRAQCSTRGNLSYSEFLNQSINHHTKPQEITTIELAFEHIIDNETQVFRVIRTWTKNQRNGKDNLGILVDDWPDVSLVKIWDEYIENLIPLGISNLFLFDGEQVKELAENEITPPVVINAIQSLLGLELAERLSIDLEILVHRQRKDIAGAKELVTLEQIEKQLDYLRKDYTLAKQELAVLQNNLDYSRKQHYLAQEKFLSEGGKIAAESSQLKQQSDDSSAALEQARQKIIELASDILPLGLILPLLIQAQSQVEKEYRTSQAKSALNVLIERDKRLLNCINQLNLLTEQIDKIKSFLASENQYLQQEICSEKELWLTDDTEILKQLDNLLQQDLPSQIKQAQEQLVNISNQEEEILAIEKQLATAASPEEYEKLANAVRTSQVLLIESQTTYDVGQRRIEELAAAIENKKKDLQEYSKQNIDSKNYEHIIYASAKVQDTLKLFREQLAIKKLGQLEDEITKHFRFLLHKSDLVHRITIDISTFSLSLYEFNGQPVPKHRLSAGEKQLLAIAFLWGLAKVSGLRLPVAIDTPLGRLDSSHRQNLVDKYFPAASHQVILLSTDTEIGKKEVETLREKEAIAREYLLKYDSSTRQTTVVENQYFW
ncbi:DNA sulfur modification protein DndD [Nostoc sp. DedQUE09]|uniref:DNA sulfur modification protein DndD n=1 Tax=Nostoc sp. DedQUE09 TaxID=3075394 RepID=UPI002AD3127E|nr:DNA sulfur modification protein DndD [Nostoc sp. DedQUE09]MDZ7952833.1 DNA sulfur modification protein DndD [Nostoc sp. DedQUE09]